VEAPASSANLGSGFDIFALALKYPRDRLVLESADSGVTIRLTEPDRLPENPKENVAGVVAGAIMADHGVKRGVVMTLRKRVPVGAGLGSSAASSVAAAVGTGAFFRLGLSAADTVRYAGIGERAASGTAHYDNVTASLVGGFVVVGKRFSHVRMAPPSSLRLCLVTPRVPLPKEKTRYARSLLPTELPFERLVDATRAASMMLHGFAVGSVEEIGEAMGQSPVDEKRSVMIPGFEKVRAAAMSHGAAGVCISGAGPSVLAACRSKAKEKVLKAMTKAFKAAGVESTGFATAVGEGCRVLER